MPAPETARLIAELTLKDKLTPGVRTATSSLNKLDKSFGNTQKSLGQTASNIGKLGVAAAAAAGGGLVLAVNAARDWESAFAGVRKTVDPTTVDLDKLGESIRAMSREIPISATELAGLAEQAGALGIAGGDIEEFTRITALLGVTTNVAAADAATALGQLSNILGLTGADYDNFAATLVDLGNKGASTEAQILEFTTRVSGAGKLIGLSAGEVLGFSAALANAGLEAEAGGTAISRFFLETFKDVTQGTKDLKTLAKLAGQTGKQFQKSFKEDAAGALESVIVGLSKMSEAQRLATLEALGFKDVRVRDTLLRLTGDSNNLTSALDIQAEAWAANTALTKEAEQRFATFDSQMQITKQILNDVAITIGSKLLPKLVPLLKRLNEFVTQNQGKIEEFGTKLADGFEKFADALGRVDWKPFIDGLKTTIEFAKGGVDLFLSLPDDIKKLIVGAAAVNKLTGGLVTSLGKDIGKIVFDQFAGRGASPANPLFVSAVGGLPGGPGGPGVPPAVPPGITPAIGAGIAIPKLDIASDPGLSGLQEELTGVKTAVTDVGKAVGALDATAKGGFGGLSIDEREQIRSTNAVSDRLEDNRGAVTKWGSLAVNAQEKARLDAIGQAGAMQKAAAAIRAAELTEGQLIRTQVQRSGERNEGKLSQIKADAARYASGQAAAAAAIKAAIIQTTAAAQQSAAAIRDKDWSPVVRTNINLSVSTKVSVSESINAQTTFKKAGNYAF